MILTIIADIPPIEGEIKVNLKNSFGYFAMKKDIVTQLYLNSVNALNQNIQFKGLTGTMKICKFENHDGKILIKG